MGEEAGTILNFKDMNVAHTRSPEHIRFRFTLLSVILHLKTLLPSAVFTTARICPRKCLRNACEN